MRRVMGLALVSLMLVEWAVWPMETRAQLAVLETNSLPILFQLAESVRRQIELVQQGARDLAPWLDGSHLAQDLETLVRLGTKLAGIGETLSARRAGWMDLTSDEQRPKTLVDLDTWVFQARTWAIAGAREASSALEMIEEAVGLLNSALSLLSRIPGLSGSVGGLQSVTAALSSLQGLFAGMQGMIAPFHQALLGQQMIRDVAAQVWRESISVHHLSDWGTLE